jgi:hypothetical protein
MGAGSCPDITAAVSAACAAAAAAAAALLADTSFNTSRTRVFRGCQPRALAGAAGTTASGTARVSATGSPQHALAWLNELCGTTL